MTNPSEVVVSDAEIEALLAPLRARYLRPALRLALADFLAKRVPDGFSNRAMEEGAKSSGAAFNGAYMLGYNALRERVLKGE